MKKWIITVAATGLTIALATYAIKKVNEALEAFYEDDTEDLPEGVEGFSPTWRTLLPPEAQEVIDKALKNFPDGWIKASRPQRKEEPTWDRVQADQAQG